MRLYLRTLAMAPNQKHCLMESAKFMVGEKWMTGQGHRVGSRDGHKAQTFRGLFQCSSHACLMKCLFLWEDQQGLMASVPHLLHLQVGPLPWVIR